MEKDKSRGIKHIKDKRKYKGNTNKNPKYVPQKNQSNLGSNWDRYETEEIGNDEEIGDSDFSLLANAPVTKGKHFLSKNDKLLALETQATSLNKLFSLDLKKLEQDLLTIPFYKRVNIDRKYFLSNEIEFMNSEAKENLNKYKVNETLNLVEKHLQHVEIKNNEEHKNEEILEQWLDDFLNE